LSWTDPSLLAVGAALTALVLLGLWSHARRRRLLAEFLGGRSAMSRLSRPDLQRLGLRRALLLGAAGLALAVASAEPAWEDAPEPPPPPMKRVILAVDVSASMQAEDEAPTRLGSAVAAAHAALDSLASHEVGLLLFAGTAYPLAPPTLDHDALRFLLSGIVPRLASAQDPGTILSVAIDESVALLDRQPSVTPGEAAPRADAAATVPAGAPGEPTPPGAVDAGAGAAVRSATTPPEPADGDRLVVLISDGDTRERAEDVLAAVERARAAEVGLYAIGVGSEAGARMVMPAGTYQLGGPVVDARGVPGSSRLGEPLLRQVATDGGGAYAHAGSVDDVQAIHVALADTGPAPTPVVDASAPVWARYDLPFLLGATALGLVALESLLGMSLPVLRIARAREAS
jgi:Ca-activated chloride channel family protein